MATKEILYNGIGLDDLWPPRYQETTLTEPLPVLYLVNPPEVININIGRQLFVDDFLIEETNMQRGFHYPVVVDEGPVFAPYTALEVNEGYCPHACPFNDGIFYDEKDKRFKMWYHSGWLDGTSYAESEDGVTWTRLSELAPERDERIIPAQSGLRRDGAGVWLDDNAKDPLERYKMFIYFRQFSLDTKNYHNTLRGERPMSNYAVLLKSANGIDWEPVCRTGPCGDNTNFFYNPFRNKWVYSIRYNSRLDSRVRIRGYYECDDFFDADWRPGDVSFWARTDINDRPDKDMGHFPQLYNLDAVGYESLMLGMYGVFQGPPNHVCELTGHPKIIDLKLAYSRDGFHWSRPDYHPFIPSSRTDKSWNYGYLHTHGGVCLVVGDTLYFYFSAYSGISPKFGLDMYAGGSVGRAVLRRDGFASMNAQTDGVLTTRILIFDGTHLFVNADIGGHGRLDCEILDEEGKVIAPFTRENCTPCFENGTKLAIAWKETSSLEAVANRPVKIRFYAADTALYAFWVSPSKTGVSHGYMAAGGPGFKNGVDIL